MAEVLLFHHAMGLTRGVTTFAGHLRAAGHTVHTPDLYGSRSFDTLDAGLAHARELGFGTLMERGVLAAEEIGHEVVFAGFSLGAMPAQMLAQTRPARGLLLFHGAIHPHEFGGTWPSQVPVQIHAMAADPYFAGEGGDIDAAREIVAAADSGALFLYPGDRHLFTDSSLPAYDPKATALVLKRSLDFLCLC